MKYLVVSDTHGDHQILEKLRDHYQDQVDAMLYCGDSEFPADDEIWASFVPVKGNCDLDFKYPSEEVLTLGDDKILLVHGHLHGVKYGLNSLSLASQEVGANLVFFGHTHQLGYEFVDNCLFLNPGSISFPRGPYLSLKGTFAIVTTTFNEVKVQYFTRDLKEVTSLSHVFPKIKN